MKELQDSIHAVHESMVGEEKSTAGDKYETARVMAQNEFTRLTNQLDVLKSESGHLQLMHPKETCHSVQVGALVQTKTRSLYIATGLGKIEVKGEIVIAISPSSPLAQAFMTKKKGDVVEFQGNKEEITSIS